MTEQLSQQRLAHLCNNSRCDLTETERSIKIARSMMVLAVSWVPSLDSLPKDSVLHVGLSMGLLGHPNSTAASFQEQMFQEKGRRNSKFLNAWPW